jgi:hypothetical protein
MLTQTRAHRIRIGIQYGATYRKTCAPIISVASRVGVDHRGESHHRSKDNIDATNQRKDVRAFKTATPACARVDRRCTR